MKAREGDEIDYGCGRVAGSFRNDVQDDVSISADDFAISLPGAPDDLGRWLCPDCKKEVVSLSGGHWRVISRHGWL